MRNLFTSTDITNSNERPVVRNVTGDFLENNLAGASTESWLNDPIGSGLKSTQQLLVDWSDFSKHVFFNSAEAKVNLAFDQIINGYPFDGTSEEKREFMTNIGGYTKWIYDQLDSHLGYLNFSDNTDTDWSYSEVIDHTGYLAPDLATIVGDAKASRHMNTNGSTHEFWLYVPDDGGTSSGMTANQYAVIYQKSDIAQNVNSSGEITKGITIWHGHQTLNAESQIREYDCSFMIGSGNFKSIVHTIEALEVDRWYHVAFVYERASSERVLSYVNGRYISNTTVNQAELDDITLSGGKIRIGWSDIRQTGYATDFMLNKLGGNDPVPYKGLLDEVRVWLGPRTADSILKNYNRNVNNEEALLVYYRFNEPPTTVGSYGARMIVLDYSGNSLHSMLTSQTSNPLVLRNRFVLASGEELSPPVAREKISENKILFPDWIPNKTLNQELLLEGNHFDRNNPNIITGLVPMHLFEEATFFEGIETDWETPKTFETSSAEYPIPGHGVLPTRLVLMSFLYMWANFFDDIKLYIDAFSTIDKVNYDEYDQIPPQLITFLSDYYGITLPDPYTNETPDRYLDGENVEIIDGVHTPLKKTIDQMWRRVLINLPFLLRSRGTVAGIKALFNTLGIESDGIFKFREYGGNISNKITSSRRKRKKRIKLLDFSQISYAKSNSLWAYRHEPGAPDANAAPVMSSINQQFGDIVYSTPAGPPVNTQYTSGSWCYEGRYTIDSDVDTCSLFRIEKDGEILVNLVAHRALNPQSLAYDTAGLQLYFDGHRNSTEPVFLELENVNLWDNSAWYVQVYHELNDNPRIGVRLMKANDKYIVENHHASTVIEKDDPDANTNEAPILYSYLLPDGSTNRNPDSLRYYIGTDVNSSYSTAQGSYNNPDTQWPNPAGEYARTTNYSGSVSHVRFWTKVISEDIAKEHVKNPFSVATENPISSFAFMTAPNSQLNPTTGLFENVPLEKYSSTYEHGLPVGSWERLRQSFDMLQGETVLATTGSLHIWDTSQNDNNMTIYGTASNDKVFKIQEIAYNISSADFDFNSASNKVRIRSFQDKEKAEENFVEHGKIVRIPSQVGVDDRRFSIESSLVHALSEDMLNLTGDSDIFNNYLGAPELEYAIEYPEIRKLRDLYFERIVGRVNYNSVIEFQRWFNGNFASLVEQFIPHTADFLGINFVIESHLLERHKFEYKQGDVHVDVMDRVAFEQEPIFIGVIKSEIT